MNLHHSNRQAGGSWCRNYDMKVVKKIFGKITKCISRDTGMPYMDWRNEFVGTPGVLVILESEKKHPGKAFACFYPYEDGWDPTYSFTHILRRT